MILHTPIPFDIIEAILQQLSNCTDTLRTTSLVSHSFLIPSQRRLFSNFALWINYYEGSSLARLDKICTLFLENPVLARYVKHLRFSTSGEGNASYAESEGGTFAIDSSIRSLFRLLQNVRSLTLSTRWDRLTQTCHDAIIDLCNSPHFYHMDAMGLHAFPMTCFSGILQASRITLRGTRISYVAKPEMQTGVVEKDTLLKVKGHLDVLEFDEDTFHDKTPDRFSNTFTHPDAPLNVSGLRLLKLNGNSPKLMEEAWSIIQVAAPKLEYFIWDLLSYRYGPPDNDFRHSLPFGTIDLTHMSALRLLAFAIGMAQANNTWILESLTHMADRNHLSTLIIAIYCCPHQPDLLNIQVFLAYLDERLFGGGFPHLTAVTVYLCVGPKHSTSPNWTMRDSIFSRMPRLGRAGILIVEYIKELRRDSGPFCVDSILA